MATPITSVARFKMTYAQSGLTHVFHAYVRPTGGSAAPGGNVDYRDASSVGWTVAAQGLWDTFKSLVGSSGPTIEYQGRTGPMWVTVDAYSPTGSATGGVTIAKQTTLTLRDASAHKLRIEIMESNYGSMPYHTVSKGDLLVYFPTLKEWTEDYVGTDAPYLWQLSRDAENIGVFPFVALTTTLNTKLRRARGLV